MHGVADIAIGNRLSRLVLRDVALPASDHRLRPGRTFAEQIGGTSLCQAEPVAPVVGWNLVGPGSDWSEVPVCGVSAGRAGR